jgi:dTDP-4-amino-4,6-dideoxygalactose transaminase
MKIPFLRPNPPRLSELLGELIKIEESGIFTNYGPVNTRFEGQATEKIFGGEGGCVTVTNATIGLMIAMVEAIGGRPTGRRYALMPSFTFAATAQAAIWAGLTPLLCDIDPDTWLPCPKSEAVLLERYGSEIALLVPYATFGNNLDLEHYKALSREYEIPVVIDAAASLGSIDAEGHGFGAGSLFSIVYSMHATKIFATSEGGIIYSADRERLARLRAMGNFGFEQPRNATMPGLNAKLSEVAALIALERLRDFEKIVSHRAELAATYRAGLAPEIRVQRRIGRRLAYQTMPVLLPDALAPQRADILAHLAAQKIGAACYFSPHLAEQPFFRDTCVIGELPNTETISRRILSLPMSDLMVSEEVEVVCHALNRASGLSRA